MQGCGNSKMSVSVYLCVRVGGCEFSVSSMKGLASLQKASICLLPNGKDFLNQAVFFMPSLQKTESSSQLSGANLWWPILLFVITDSRKTRLQKLREMSVLTHESLLCLEFALADASLASALGFEGRSWILRISLCFQALSRDPEVMQLGQGRRNFVGNKGVNKRPFPIFLLEGLVFWMVSTFTK